MSFWSKLFVFTHDRPPDNYENHYFTGSVLNKYEMSMYYKKYNLKTSESLKEMLTNYKHYRIYTKELYKCCYYVEDDEGNEYEVLSSRIK